MVQSEELLAIRFRVTEFEALTWSKLYLSFFFYVKTVFIPTLAFPTMTRHPLGLGIIHVGLLSTYAHCLCTLCSICTQ